jgi:hypothetical protein
MASEITEEGISWLPIPGGARKCLSLKVDDFWWGYFLVVPHRVNRVSRPEHKVPEPSLSKGGAAHVRPTIGKGRHFRGITAMLVCANSCIQENKDTLHPNHSIKNRNSIDREQKKIGLAIYGKLLGR